MNGKKELVMLIIGLVLLIFDLVTDIIVAVQYGLEGEYVWFGLTLGFIIAPLFFVNLMAAAQTDDDYCEKLSCCSIFLCSSIFVRYSQEFSYWKREYRDIPPCGGNCEERDCDDCRQYKEVIEESKKSSYNLAWIRYVETLAESTPQWCFQVYVMLHQWSFPKSTVLSVVGSLLSLSWSITTLEKARWTRKDKHFTLQAEVVFFACQLFSLLSRLFAIVVFAYVLKEHVFTVLGIHLLTTHMITWFVGIRCDGCKCDVVALVFFYIVYSFPFLFHVSDMLTKIYSRQPTINFVLYSLIAVENILLAILAVTVPTFEATHMIELRPIALSLVIIGVLLGNILLKVYNKYLKPNETSVIEAQTPRLPLWA